MITRAFRFSSAESVPSRSVSSKMQHLSMGLDSLAVGERRYRYAARKFFPQTRSQLNGAMNQIVAADKPTKKTDDDKRGYRKDGGSGELHLPFRNRQ